MTDVLTQTPTLADRRGYTPRAHHAEKGQPVTRRSADASDQLEAPAPPSKFTVLLEPDAAADFDQLALDIRRLLGRRVSKGDLVRALIALAAADLTLRDRLLNELRTRLPA